MCGYCHDIEVIDPECAVAICNVKYMYMYIGVVKLLAGSYVKRLYLFQLRISIVLII